jgi:MoaA/NifB/PqqE/SkfB family radical SAM enzyme
MTTPSALGTSLIVRVGEAANRTLVLPLVVFYPTSACNSRCVSCDWWRHDSADDLSLAEIGDAAGQLAELGTRLVVFSGGEPLLRPDVFDAARQFAGQGAALHLLTSGVLLERCADEVARVFARVVISLDAADEARYRQIRGVQALAAVERGVARLRRLAPGLPVTARATLHRLNFRELPRLVEHARAMALDGISFLAADVSSQAFGRPWPPDPAALALDGDEVREFTAIVDAAIARYAAEFRTGFIAEPPEKLRRLPRYYAALRGDGPFPPVACNAPWTSIVIEADGGVRPCFFHERIGNLRHQPLGDIVTRGLPAFRRMLDVSSNPVCERCVCSMRTSLRSAPWH